MRAWIAVAAAAGIALASEARANCAMPVGYDVQEVSPARVRICLEDFEGRTCPDAGLLRRPVGGDATVLITTCDGDGCFLDECVPEGTYEYGLAEPFACVRSACSTSYYGTVTVTGRVEGCVRSGDAPQPADDVPWTSGDEFVCTYGNTQGSGCGTGPAVLGANLAVLLAGLALWRWRGTRRPRA